MSTETDALKAEVARAVIEMKKAIVLMQSRPPTDLADITGPTADLATATDALEHAIAGHVPEGTTPPWEKNGTTPIWEKPGA